MKGKIITLLFPILVTGCTHNGKTDSGLIHLDYQNAEYQNPPQLSTLLKDIRYVALETKDTCLLKDPYNITLTDKYIVMDGGDKTECYVFDKETGKYVRTIGMRQDPGPTGYDKCTYPLYVQGDEIYLSAGWGEKYKAFSLDDGSLLRTIDAVTDGKRWPSSYLYPLNDSTMLQYEYNHFGNRQYGLQVSTWNGNILKRFPSTNNFERNMALEYTISFHNEIIIYPYNGNLHFHEFTSDTIFRLNDRLESEPVYVVGKGDELPKPDIRNSFDDDRGKSLAKFDYILETDRYLLLMGHRWRKEGCIYDKSTSQIIRVKDEQIKGFANDLNGFLPFWPVTRGRGKAENEVWALLQPDEYIEGVEKTGKNPLGIEMQFDDNPVIVIGTLK